MACSTLVRPSSDIDLFSDAALQDPYPLYRQLRDAGPAVWLERQQLWFLGRYDVVKAALTDWSTWSSAQGIGLNPVLNEAWKDALICVDPPVQTSMRKLFTDRLGPRQLQSVEQGISRRADDLAERVVSMGTFDGVTDVAHDLPVNVIMDLIGWPEEVRSGLLEMADGGFDAAGPDNPRMRAALPRLQQMMAFVADTFDANRLLPGGFGSTVVEAAHRGEIDRGAAIGLLVGYIVAAFDTTISAIATGLVQFARHPDQWARLRAGGAPMLASAFNEIVRIEAPIQHFSRVATRDVDLGEGVVVPAGARAIVSYGAANRDERHFTDPDRFDIGRRPADHVGFGVGVHACAGQGLARLEGHAVFAALARRIERFELLGDPALSLNNINRGYRRIPMRAVAASAV